jgi:hypothetical protein
MGVRHDDDHATGRMGDARVLRALQRGYPHLRGGPGPRVAAHARRSVRGRLPTILFRADPLVPIMGILSVLGAVVFAINSGGRAAVLAWIGIALIALIIVASITLAEPINPRFGGFPRARRPIESSGCGAPGAGFTGPAPSWRWAPLPVWWPPVFSASRAASINRWHHDDPVTSASLRLVRAVSRPPVGVPAAARKRNSR